jgi:hypothetical protein
MEIFTFLVQDQLILLKTIPNQFFGKKKIKFRFEKNLKNHHFSKKKLGNLWKFILF